eukprot:940675-Amphidinium_carterae.1
MALMAGQGGSLAPEENCLFDTKWSAGWRGTTQALHLDSSAENPTHLLQFVREIKSMWETAREIVRSICVDTSFCPQHDMES